MENFTVLKIFLKDSKITNNKYNKDLFKFLKNNLQEIADSKFYTRLIVVDETNIKKFVKKGIKKTPALLNESDGNIITGVENIIQYIISKCEDEVEVLTNKQPPKQKVSGRDDLREYLMEQAMSLDNEPEEPLNLDKFKQYDDSYKNNRERLQSRNINTNKNIMNNLKKNNTLNISNDNAEANEFINNSNEETKNTRNISDYDMDDDIKNFWQNQEETII